MTAITYTATRNISSGHSASTSYNLEPEMTVLAPSDQPNVNQSFTLSGTPETVFNNLTEMWSVTTTIIGQSSYDLYREFWSSVAGGETFTFDAYGSIATPDDAISVIMVGGARPQRVGVQELWKFSFRMRAI